MSMMVEDSPPQTSPVMPELKTLESVSNSEKIANHLWRRLPLLGLELSLYNYLYNVYVQF